MGDAGRLAVDVVNMEEISGETWIDEDMLRAHVNTSTCFYLSPFLPPLLPPLPHTCHPRPPSRPSS